MPWHLPQKNQPFEGWVNNVRSAMVPFPSEGLHGLMRCAILPWGERYLTHDLNRLLRYSSASKTLIIGVVVYCMTYALSRDLTVINPSAAAA
jgi:hypothetical protein